MEEYTIIRCNSGFLLKKLDNMPPVTPGSYSSAWAFSTIEELTAFINAQYAPPPSVGVVF